MVNRQIPLLVVFASADTLKQMSRKVQAVMDEIRALPHDEQREVPDFILQHIVSIPATSAHRRLIVDMAGKYRATPDMEAKDHDCGFAAAAAD